MRKLLIFYFSFLALIPSVFALQSKAAKDNETLFFKLSAKEFSRILVTDDRIISVKGKDGSYELNKFNGKYDEGVIYIKPTVFYQRRPFSLFITTELGRNFTLFLSPLDIPAENIAIKPISSVKALASKWEKNQEYTQLIISLMRDMVNEVHPEGYAVIPMGELKPKMLTSLLSMQLLTIYRGSLLEGEVWRIKNHTHHTVHLSPRQFYQSNTRGAALIDETLNANDETILYRVVSHD